MYVTRFCFRRSEGGGAATGTGVAGAGVEAGPSASEAGAPAATKGERTGSVDGARP